MFGGNAFAWPPFAGAVGRLIRRIPGFTTGVVLAASSAEASAVPGDAAEGSAVAASVAEGDAVAGSASSIHAVPSSVSEGSTGRRWA